jgi:hypothetical protein
MPTQRVPAGFEEDAEERGLERGLEQGLERASCTWRAPGLPQHQPRAAAHPSCLLLHP